MWPGVDKGVALGQLPPAVAVVKQAVRTNSKVAESAESLTISPPAPRDQSSMDFEYARNVEIVEAPESVKDFVRPWRSGDVADSWEEGRCWRGLSFVPDEQSMSMESEGADLKTVETVAQQGHRRRSRNVGALWRNKAEIQRLQ